MHYFILFFIIALTLFPSYGQAQPSEQQQRQQFADMMAQANRGFDPNAPSDVKANSRLGFELGINSFHYDLVGIKKLIDMGAFKKGHIPSSSFLFTAQKEGDLALVKLLIENGADFNGADERGFTVLHRAIGYDHTEIALALIEAGASLKDSSDLAETPLIAAAGQGNLVIVKALLEAGADINQIVVKTKRREESALTQAIGRKQLHVVEYLTKAGAKLTEKQNLYLHDAYKDPFVNNGEKKCSTDTRLCPDKSRVKRAGDSCEFPACPLPKKYESVEAIKGTFSEIDTELSAKATFVLNNGSKEEKDKVIAEIKESPENYNPSALNALSRTLFSRIEDEEGAFWFLAADLRKNYDVLICRDKTAESKLASYYNMVQQFKPYAELNPVKVKKIFEDVMKWDRETAYDYDPRWVNIGSGIRDNKITDKIPDNLCADADKRDGFKESNRVLYVSKFRGYLNKFDYAAAPNRKINTSGKEEITQESFNEILAKAEKGDSEAQFRITTLPYIKLLNGKSNKEKEQFINQWLTKAAEQEHKNAIYFLGKQYLNGYIYYPRSIKLDEEKGKALLIRAVKKEHALSYSGLGNYYSKQGDIIDAYAWYALGEHVMRSKHPKLRMTPDIKKRIELEATLNGDDLQKAKDKAAEYIKQYAKEQK